MQWKLRIRKVYWVKWNMLNYKLRRMINQVLNVKICDWRPLIVNIGSENSKTPKIGQIRNGFLCHMNVIRFLRQKLNEVSLHQSQQKQIQNFRSLCFQTFLGKTGWIKKYSLLKCLFYITLGYFLLLYIWPRLMESQIMLSIG